MSIYFRDAVRMKWYKTYDSIWNSPWHTAAAQQMLATWISTTIIIISSFIKFPLNILQINFHIFFIGKQRMFWRRPPQNLTPNPQDEVSIILFLPWHPLALYLARPSQCARLSERADSECGCVWGAGDEGAALGRGEKGYEDNIKGFQST